MVNAAAYRSAAEIGARRWLTALGSAACPGSLLVLLVRSLAEDPVGLIVLAILVVTALGTEALVLRRRRQPGSAWSEVSGQALGPPDGRRRCGPWPAPSARPGR